MSQNIKQLKNRIKSVDNTLHLTKAMGLVASSKIRKATDRMMKGREYESAIGSMIHTLVASPECANSPYLAVRPPERTRLVIVAGDRGLAGGYNANIFRLSRDLTEGAEITAIGKRAVDRFGGEIIYAEHFTYDQAFAMAKAFCDDYAEGKFDRLGVICTKYVNVMTQDAVVRWLFPLEKPEGEKARSVVFEPDENTILNTAIYEYVAGSLVAAVRESFASEVAARRTAMDSAGKNAQEMIDNLQLEYNRARQSSITSEITEIVAGSGS
ncbi:MAG: ATP synthase F1 subunit gamma [Eubacterium sp.]|nr:ATP synthase F1 subunit gamma [Eubacterium sp.]